MEPTRRDFLTITASSVAAAGTVLSTVAASGLIGGIGDARAETPPGAGASTAGALTTHVLPPLPYKYDALEPHIDAQTMELHHSKHHAAYVKGLIEAEAALERARAAQDFSLVQHWSRRAAFNGGGHFLHSMFWESMAAPGTGAGKGGGEPQGALRKKIEEDFGSVASFKAHFSAAANGVEGGGWALLHYRPADKRLLVLQAENQHKLSPWDTKPLLGIDVWEHAYYLKYQNKRPDYVTAWWNVVSWDRVASRLDEAIKNG